MTNLTTGQQKKYCLPRFSENRFLLLSYRMATATNRMHRNDLKACGKKCCYFWFHSEVDILAHFDVFLELVILAQFHAISM